MPSSITLRPYQQNLIDSINEALTKAPRVMLQLPTGGGKTVIFCQIVKQYLDKGKKSIIVVHRKELLDQASRALSKLGIEHSLIAPGERTNPEHSVIVASVQSLNRKTLTFEPDILIIDEGHHAAGNNNWTKAIKKWPKAKTLGVTATPCRLDGQSLGNLFQILVPGPATADLISQKYLAPVRVFSPQASVTAEGIGTRVGEYIQSQLVERFDTPQVAAEAVDNFKRICPDAKAIVFCCSVLHAEHTAQAFQEAGFSSACLHGKLSKTDRESLLQQFAEGKIQVITSRDLISEGTDIPDAQAAILLRPTQSESLYLQQVGRVLRTSPKKRFAVIIDLAGNTWKHGLPDDPREWSITRGLRKTRVVQISKCTCCDSILNKAQEFCDNCGTKNPDYRPREQGKKDIAPLLSQEEVARLEIEELNLSEVTDRIDFIIRREIRLNCNRWYGIRLHWLLNENRDKLTEAQVNSFENMLSSYVFDSKKAWAYVGIDNTEMDGKPFDVLSAYKNKTELKCRNRIPYSNWPMFIQVMGNRFMENVMSERKYEIYVGSYSRYVNVELQDLRFYDTNSKKLLTYYEIDPLIQALMIYYVPSEELRYRLAKGECYWGR
jgi:superfamily II DNA or RNA helicase|tara:strand:+ start:489 stop:2309 length:1821 start_codon:yes stop_codon:yes gene_type:complete